MKSIPVEKIDTLIAELEENLKDYWKEWGSNSQKPISAEARLWQLKQIKKESEEMIPLTDIKKEFILEALEHLDDEDSMNRCKLALSKGTAAYPTSILKDFQERVNHLEKRIELCNQIKEDLKKELTKGTL